MKFVPLVLSALLLAAHFYRGGEIGFVLLTLAAPLFLLIRHPVAVRTVQVLLLFGAAEWIRTAWVLADHRLDSGAPFARMLAILGAVALFTILSALPLRRLATPAA